MFYLIVSDTEICVKKTIMIFQTQTEIVEKVIQMSVMCREIKCKIEYNIYERTVVTTKEQYKNINDIERTIVLYE